MKINRMRAKNILFIIAFIIITGILNGQTIHNLPPCTTPVVYLSGATNLCQGSTTTICATGGTTYHWSTGATSSCINVRPPASITYTVEVSNLPCFKDTTFTIIVDTMPNVRITGDSVCSGDSTILHAYGGYAYFWSTGATNDSILGKLDSTYYVTVAKGACSKDSTKIKVIRWCTGIQTFSNQSATSISPNPCTTTLNIDFETRLNLSSIQITDITGRVLLTDHCQLTTDHFPTDVSALSPGMYFIRINSGSGTEVKKFIKE
jgi:hypothetical protein